MKMGAWPDAAELVAPRAATMAISSDGVQADNRSDDSRLKASQE